MTSHDIFARLPHRCHLFAVTLAYVPRRWQQLSATEPPYSTSEHVRLRAGDSTLVTPWASTRLFPPKRALPGHGTRPCDGRTAGAGLGGRRLRKTVFIFCYLTTKMGETRKSAVPGSCRYKLADFTKRKRPKVEKKKKRETEEETKNVETLRETKRKKTNVCEKHCRRMIKMWCKEHDGNVSHTP